MQCFFHKILIILILTPVLVLRNYILISFCNPQKKKLKIISHLSFFSLSASFVFISFKFISFLLLFHLQFSRCLFILRVNLHNVTKWTVTVILFSLFSSCLKHYISQPHALYQLTASCVVSFSFFISFLHEKNVATIASKIDRLRPVVHEW